MNAIHYNGTVADLAGEVAIQLKDFFTGKSSDRNIGLTEEGECDFEYIGVNGGGVVIAVSLYTTEDGWTFGDWAGDYTDADSWTEEAVAGLTGDLIESIEYSMGDWEYPVIFE